VPVRRALSILLVLPLLAAGCGGGEGGALGALGEPDEPNATDAAFAQAMVPHQREGLAMAELARERALRKELRRIARDMRGPRRDEIGRLGAIAAELAREGVRAPRGAMSRRPADIDDLRSAVSFDLRFMELLIRHHEDAIAMAEEEQDRGGDRELRRLAGEIQERHERELEALRRWLRTWYGEGVLPGEGGGGGGGEGEQPAPDGEGGDEGPGGGEGGGAPEGPPI
jgi:uncharacterized protein (DUF305 family)